jgi:tetratricopeptide (TPR) repeat protein
MDPLELCLLADTSAVLDTDSRIVLESEESKILLSPLSTIMSDVSLIQETFPDTIMTATIKFLDDRKNHQAAQLCVLKAGVACLHLFIQANVTGPPVASLAFLAPYSSSILDHLRDVCNALLTVNGEQFYQHSKFPVLLVLARIFLISARCHLTACLSVDWWALRCVAWHQRGLETQTDNLKALSDVLIPSVLKRFAQSPASTNGDVALQVRCLLECGQMQRFYWKPRVLQANITQSKTLLGLSTAFSGILGKRTRYQVDDKTQLVLLVSRVGGSDNSESTVQVNITEASPSRPQEVNQEAKGPDASASGTSMLRPPVSANTDDLYLDRVSFSAPGSTDGVALSGLELAVLLAEMDFLKASSPASELSRTELGVYVDRVLCTDPQQQSYVVAAYALLHRARLQMKDSHYQLRSLSQLEDIIKHMQLSCPPEELSEVCASRRVDVHTVPFPYTWQVTKWLADELFELKMTRHALDLYRSIHEYEKIIQCLISNKRLTDAEELIRAELKSQPNNPALWCHLGEVTNDVSHYATAWEISGRRHGAAQRALGTDKRIRGRHEEAIGHYRLALEVNSAMPDQWFALGFCALEIKDYDTAVQAFGSAVGLQPDYSEAWNNIAAAHLHLQNIRPAFAALEHCVRLNRRSWKMWENYLTCAMQLGEIQKALSAIQQVAELRATAQEPGPRVDKLVLDRLTTLIVELVGEGARLVDMNPDVTLQISSATSAEKPAKETELKQEQDATSPYLSPAYASLAPADSFNRSVRSVNNASANFTVSQFNKVLKTLTDLEVDDPCVWDATARFQSALGNSSLAIEARLKLCQRLHKVGWTRSLDTFRPGVVGLEQLTEAYLALSTSDLFAAKLHLQVATRMYLRELRHIAFQFFLC